MKEINRILKLGKAVAYYKDIRQCLREDPYLSNTKLRDKNAKLVFV